MTEDLWRELVDDFHAAAVGQLQWDRALSGLADLCRARSGQLIAVRRDGTMPFNWVTNIDPACVAAFEALDGGNPQINPRVRAGLAARRLEVLGESDFGDRDEVMSTPIYADFFLREDIPFIGLSTLMDDGESTYGMSVMRTARQGHIEGEQRAILAAIAPHVQGAVSLQLALEGQGARLMAGALEAVAAAAFVVDIEGRVRAMTPAAEACLAEKCGLALADGRLVADDPALALAVSDVLGPRRRGGVVALKVAHSVLPLMLEVSPTAAAEHAFTAAPRAVIVVLNRRRPQRRGREIADAFGFTPAEAEVALDLGEGLAPAQIAARRGVAVATVRSQLRAIFLKTGVSRQAELAALMLSVGLR